MHRIVLKGLSLDLETELLRDATKIDVPDSDGRTPLHWAAGRGDLKAVLTLLRHGADPNRAGRIGQGPLRSAIKASDPACMEAFLESGARVIQRDRWEQTCLQAAMYDIDPIPFIIPLINAGIDINATDFSGAFALLEAVRYGHINAVIMLIDHGADVDLADIRGHTPFIAAVDRNNHAMVRILLETARVETGARDRTMQTVLHVAAEKSDTNMLMLLTAARTQDLSADQIREDGMSPVQVAEKR